MNRISHEIEHGKKIVDDAEFYWGWGTPAGKERLRRRAEMLTEYGELGPGKRVLELGCGKGLYTKELVKSAATIAAIDISWDLLKAAEKISEKPGYLVGDGHGLPFADNTFDSVVGVSVLHHLEVEEVIVESTRVLKPGGRFVFSEPNMLNPQIAVQKNIPWIKRMLGDSPDETAFRKGPLKSLLEQVGLEVIEITPFDFLHPWVPKPLIGLVDKTGRLIEKIPALREIAGSLIIVARKH
ncbi:MAG: methyltransferase domain-containing protein [Candidatus Omnitrophica bacterium]|nr:methyltransferase domain-containing protein [Candidatus Omnitrophota bacterium]MCB9784767.1 methyltransferase domain-containing protein [Candidatus Omnitrophota bacterium]